MPIAPPLHKKLKKHIKKLAFQDNPTNAIHDEVLAHTDLLEEAHEKLDSLDTKLSDSTTEIQEDIGEAKDEIINKLNEPEEPDDSLEQVLSKISMIKGEKGDQGEKGETGNDGVGIQGATGKDGRDGIDGKPGKDGKDGADGKEGIDGKDGKPGKDGDDGKSASPKDIIEYLKNAPEEDKLDITSLRNFQSLLPKKGSGYKLDDQRWHGGGSNEAIISFIVDGGGSAISTGIVGDLSIQFNCEIKEVMMLADQSGSAVVDIWMADFASYPPTVANTITASTPPTISSALKSRDTTLTGWTRNLILGDTLRYNVNSASSITRLLISLKVTKK